MINAINAALSGMTAATTRVGVSANNIANQRDTAPVPTANAPYQGYQPQQVQQTTAAGGGTVATTAPVHPSFVLAFSLGAPDADPSGMVSQPNVPMEGQVVGLVQAQQTFAANLKTVQTADKMLGSVLDIKN